MALIKAEIPYELLARWAQRLKAELNESTGKYELTGTELIQYIQFIDVIFDDETGEILGTKTTGLRKVKEAVDNEIDFPLDQAVTIAVQQSLAAIDAKEAERSAMAVTLGNEQAARADTERARARAEQALTSAQQAHASDAASMQQEIATKDAEIASKNRRLADMTSDLMAKAAEVAGKEAEIAKLKADLESARGMARNG